MKILNNMAMKLQYVSEEQVLKFISKMDEVSTDAILADAGIQALLAGKEPDQISKHDNPLGTAESLLQLFIDREEYEVCATLLWSVPELAYNNDVKTA
jgi:hypothetical protein|tara:strand:+ start:327 stop:620 length:294 start_codon:yes stop_codon:yes gene_type:complete